MFLLYYNMVEWQCLDLRSEMRPVQALGDLKVVWFEDIVNLSGNQFSHLQPN